MFRLVFRLIRRDLGKVVDRGVLDGEDDGVRRLARDNALVPVSEVLHDEGVHVEKRRRELLGSAGGIRDGQRGDAVVVLEKLWQGDSDIAQVDGWNRNRYLLFSPSRGHPGFKEHVDSLAEVERPVSLRAETELDDIVANRLVLVGDHHGEAIGLVARVVVIGLSAPMHGKREKVQVAEQRIFVIPVFLQFAWLRALGGPSVGALLLGDGIGDRRIHLLAQLRGEGADAAVRRHHALRLRGLVLQGLALLFFRLLAIGGLLLGDLLVDSHVGLLARFQRGGEMPTSGILVADDPVVQSEVGVEHHPLVGVGGVGRKRDLGGFARAGSRHALVAGRIVPKVAPLALSPVERVLRLLVFAGVELHLSIFHRGEETALVQARLIVKLQIGSEADPVPGVDDARFEIAHRVVGAQSFHVPAGREAARLREQHGKEGRADEKGSEVRC